MLLIRAIYLFPIQSIVYDAILEKSGEKIGSGLLTEFLLEAKKQTQIPFDQQINWVPTAQLASELVLQEEVLIRIDGELLLNIPKLDEYSIPFSQTVDIKEYITQFVPVSTQLLEPVQSQSEQISEQVDSVNDNQGTLETIPEVPSLQ